MTNSILHLRARHLCAILTAPFGAAGDDWLSRDQRQRYEAELDSIRAEIEAREHAARNTEGNANG